MSHSLNPPHAPQAGAIQGIIIALTAFLPILAIVSLAPAVPTLIQHFAGVPYVETLVPLMLTAPGLVIAIAGPCTGWLADKFGRRKLLLSATLLYGICGTMPLYITSLTGIFCSRLGVGLAEAVVLTIANTMLIDYFDDKQRRFWLTVQGVIGPALAVLVLASSGYLTALRWNGAFMIYFVAILLFLAMYFWMFEPAQAARPQHAAQAAQHNPFPWPRVIALSVLTFVCAIIYYVYTINGANAFHTLQNASPQRIGLIMSLVSLAVPVGSLLFGLVSRRYKPERVLAIMLCLMGIGMLVVGESRTLIAMGIGSAIQQLGAGMAINAMIYWVGSLIPPAYCGRAMGAWSGAFFAGMFVSPIIVGAIRLRAGNDVLSAFLTLGIAALVLAAAIFLYTFSRHSQRLRQHKQASAWQLAK
ncbi:MFS transporter [Klebsiella quasipneumoniae]|uniref:MFS transporter n=1 Tax=Klebsiella quasipneumoniae TaxID=1463165 RepID=UPI00352BA695